MANLAQTDRKPDEPEKDEDTSDALEGFLRTVVKRFHRVDSAESANRQKAVEDLKFKGGDQWPDDIRAQRTLDKRPCLTVNKLKTFTHQISNDQRQNRPSIGVSPVGDRSDPETAKMLKGLIKQIERESNADVAYDTAFDSAVSIGWGYWRLLTDYEENASFDQVIRIHRIRNTMRVYMDPDHQEPDGSDSEYCFISDMMPRDEFKRTFPDAEQIAWEETGMGDEYKLWSTASHIRIAEYYCYEFEERELLALRNGHIGYRDELMPELQQQIVADPDFVVKKRMVQERKVKWYKLTSHEILEESDWPGKYIPVVKVIGDELDVQGRVTYAGLIRDAKDAQRMYNFWVTSEAELIALAPKAPWIMEEGQIEGHEERWKQANVKSLPYLLYKGTSVSGKPAPPPQRQQFAGPPAGVVQAKIGAAQDMQATTGLRFDATLQERMYDESGKALRELKRVSDLGSFHYVDNLARSLRWTGNLLIDLIPKVYDTPRMLTILREDDSEEQVRIDPSMNSPSGKRENPMNGKVEKLFNPKLGRYGVVVTIGPSYATKRAEAADSMLLFMKAVPQAAPIIGDLIAKNMDWPGADEIAARLQSTLPPQLVSKDLGQLPAEVRGLVTSLQQQLQQLKQERDQAVAMLGDQDKDRAIEVDKINKDFEAAMAKIAADLQTKMAAVEAKLAGNDPRAEYQRIAVDFEAKLLKIFADLEAKRQQTEAQLAGQIFQLAARQQEKPKDEERGLRRSSDIEPLKDMQKKLLSRIDDMEKQMSDMDKVEIVFDRDPATKRIAKARRVRRQ